MVDVSSGGVWFYLQMFLPHRAQLSHLGAEVLESEVTLSLPQLAGGQLLLQAGDVVLGDVLALGLTFLDRQSYLEDKGTISSEDLAATISVIFTAIRRDNRVENKTEQSNSLCCRHSF